MVHQICKWPYSLQYLHCHSLLSFTLSLSPLLFSPLIRPLSSHLVLFPFFLIPLSLCWFLSPLSWSFLSSFSSRFLLISSSSHLALSISSFLLFPLSSSFPFPSFFLFLSPSASFLFFPSLSFYSCFPFSPLPFHLHPSSSLPPPLPYPLSLILSSYFPFFPSSFLSYLTLSLLLILLPFKLSSCWQSKNPTTPIVPNVPKSLIAITEE